MNIDPRHPVFKYIDKIVLAVVAVIAVASIAGTLKGTTPAEEAITELSQKIEVYERAREGAAPPSGRIELDYYRSLMDRFDPEGVATGKRMREHVFFTPFEQIGPRAVLRYNMNEAVERQVSHNYKLQEFGFQTRNIDGITMRSPIVSAVADDERNAIRIMPQALGETSVRVSFRGGSTLDFDVEVVEDEAEPVRKPLAPVELAAKAIEGRIRLTFKTNPNSSPVDLYTIYRSTEIEDYGTTVGSIATMRREHPQVMGGIAERDRPRVRVASYIFDDLSATPGTTYYYRVKSAGKVMLESGETIEEQSALEDSKEVEITAGSPFVITAVGGVAGSATIEVTRWHRFVPEFRTLTAWPGERVGQNEFDTGMVLLSVEEIMVEEVQMRRMMEPGPDGRPVFVNREVTLLRPGIRVLLANEQNEIMELGRQQRNRDVIVADIQQVVENVAMAKHTEFPTVETQPIGDTRARPEIRIRNSDREDLVFVVQSRNSIARLTVPAFQERTITVDRGEYEITAIQTLAVDGKVYRRSGMQLRFNERYIIEFRSETPRPGDAAIQGDIN